MKNATKPRAGPTVPTSCSIARRRARLLLLHQPDSAPPSPLRPHGHTAPCSVPTFSRASKLGSRPLIELHQIHPHPGTAALAPYSPATNLRDLRSLRHALQRPQSQQHLNIRQPPAHYASSDSLHSPDAAVLATYSPATNLRDLRSRCHALQHPNRSNTSIQGGHPLITVHQDSPPYWCLTRQASTNLRDLRSLRHSVQRPNRSNTSM